MEVQPKDTSTSLNLDQDDKYHEPPEPCYIIEGKWAYDTEEEYERAMGREVSSENN